MKIAAIITSRKAGICKLQLFFLHSPSATLQISRRHKATIFTFQSLTKLFSEEFPRCSKKHRIGGELVENRLQVVVVWRIERTVPILACSLQNWRSVPKLLQLKDAENRPQAGKKSAQNCCFTTLWTVSFSRVVKIPKY